LEHSAEYLQSSAECLETSAEYLQSSAEYLQSAKLYLSANWCRAYVYTSYLQSWISVRLAAWSCSQLN